MILDLKRSDWLPAYDEEGIRTLLAELIEIVQKLSSSMEVLNQPNMPNAVKVRAVYLHQCLIRNHKYINGYLLHRMKKVREARWNVGSVLPENISKDVLGGKEKEYFANYSTLLADYNEMIGLDITTDMEPPKDLLIEVRVLHDCGQVWTDSGPIPLTKGSILFLRRTQVEQFIREGKVEQMLSDTSC